MTEARSTISLSMNRLISAGNDEFMFYRAADYLKLIVEKFPVY